MLKLFDKVKDEKTGKICFVIDVDDHGEDGVVYGIESEDQDDSDWFRWADESELVKVQE